MSPSANTPCKIILGSASMSRRRILEEMGYKFTLMTADIDEKAIRKERPEELVMALAEAKFRGSGKDLLVKLDNRLYNHHADAIISKIPKNEDIQKKNDEGPTLLITADQVVVHGSVIREKPSSKEEAREFIKGYSGGCASTVGSVLVTNLMTGIRKGGWDKTEVYFHEIPDEVIEKLIEEGAVLHVAGGLMIENPLASPFVNAMVGTFDSVLGLPRALTERLIKEVL